MSYFAERELQAILDRQAERDAERDAVFARPMLPFRVQAGDVVRVVIDTLNIEFEGTVEWTGRDNVWGEPAVHVRDETGKLWSVDDYDCKPLRRGA